MRMPGFIKPQLATLKMKAPGKGYLHEIKFDGYRVQIHTGSAPRAFTRNGHDWVKRFSRIAGALDIPPAIIDGEVVVVHEGRTNFSELQAELAGERQDRLLYYAFDLCGSMRKTSANRRRLNVRLYSRACSIPTSSNRLFCTAIIMRGTDKTYSRPRLV
jgi:bifunctional non-homologous end joining protein LigD